MQRAFFFKVAGIALLGLVLLIPLGLVMGQIEDRSDYRRVAADSIAKSWTGAQQVTGPMLVVPYREIRVGKHWDEARSRYVEQERQVDRQLILLPDRLEVDATLETEQRYRGIFGIPVYTSAQTFSGEFDLSPVRKLQSQATVQEVGEPRFVLAVTDNRGIAAVPELSWRGELRGFDAGSTVDGLGSGIHAPLPAMPQTIPDTAAEPSALRAAFSFQLQLQGMESLAYVPVGLSTELHVRSPWPHPSFIGAYLPRERTVREDGFSAQWQTTRFATNVEQQAETCAAGDCSSLHHNRLGVSLINPVDVYLQTERSVKYGLLFVGLTFLAFFLFEMLKGLRIHPMQYLLAGLALTLFYLLLLSLAEHIPFAWAYLVATSACIALISYYLVFVLRSRLAAGGFAAVLALLYGMLYAIIRSEDYALLMGSSLLFLALALVMVLTRKLDWYAVGERVQAGARSKDAGSLE